MAGAVYLHLLSMLWITRSRSRRRLTSRLWTTLVLPNISLALFTTSSRFYQADVK